MNTQRSNDEIREDLRRVASTATGFVHDAAMRLAGDFESLLSRLAAVEAWAMKNEIAAPPLDWAGLGAILHPPASPTPTGPEPAKCEHEQTEAHDVMVAGFPVPPWFWGSRAPGSGNRAHRGDTVSDLVPREDIERIVGAARHEWKHYARAVSSEKTVYILHSRKCLDSGIDLRDCEFSVALDHGIDLEHWRENVALVVEVLLGKLRPIGFAGPGGADPKETPDV